MACMDACPVEVPDAFNDRVGRRKAVYRPLFGNPEGLPTIDWESCTRCGACLAACPNQAVNLEPTEVRLSLAPVAGVILARGNRLYDACRHRPLRLRDPAECGDRHGLRAHPERHRPLRRQACAPF
jgi:heterodisulfide reductase subunit A-like polyferredoxin